MNKPKNYRDVIFKANYWYHEEIDNKSVIHIGGRTENGETVHILVQNFTPAVYVELSPRIAWNAEKCESLYQQIKDVMGDNQPVDKFRFKKNILHYKQPVYVLQVLFENEKGGRQLSYKFTNARGFYVSGLGHFSPGELKTHEHNIDTVLKFTAKQKIQLSGWIQAREYIQKREVDSDEEFENSEKDNLENDYEDFSTADMSMLVNHTNIKPVTSPEFDKIYIKLKYCSFDIECNSKNHNSKLPDPLIPENVIFQISMIFGFLGEPNRHKILLSLGEPRKIKNCDELKIFPDESKLLLGFTKIIQEHDPDLFIGYNIMKFDWNYMIIRASEVLGIYDKFCKMSRIIGKPADLKKQDWSSSAYGKQKFCYLECHGRTNIDVLLEIERNYRLPKYSLEVVSEKFLGKHKDDINARGLFMLWQLTDEILPQINKGKPSDKKLIEIKNRIIDIFILRKCNGIVSNYRTRLVKAAKNSINEFEKFVNVVREAMELTGKYCIQDSILPIDLIEKLNLNTTMDEMSNVAKVPKSYLHTRGQQIRALAQVLRETMENDIVIPFIKKAESDEKFQGAIVIEAHPGDYIIVPTFDFTSLYPSILIAFNICYTTILRDDDPTPDSECHVIKWHTHINCEHDPNRKKKGKVTCCPNKYRFLKIKYIIEKNGNIIRQNEGIIPRLERKLLAERKIVKKEMGKAEAIVKMNAGKASEEDIAFYKKIGIKIIEKNSLTETQAKMAQVDFNTLNAKQLSIKIIANSMYGILGVKMGMMPLVAGAACVTAMGRDLIIKAIARIKKEYSFASLIYGDSVTEDTPILCRLGVDIFYRTIDNLPKENENIIFENEKEYFIPKIGLEVWSDEGFTPIKKIIRHKTNKKIYRIITTTGVVDVTEDHSLLNENKEKIKPSEIKIGDKLLHHNLPKLSEIEKNNIKYEYMEEFSNNSEEHDGGIYTNLTKISLAEYFRMAIDVGFSVEIDVENENKIILTKKHIDNPNEIKKIIELSKNEEQYVYDLETENHHFSAGVGRLVVHNTDSCMIRFEGKNLKEVFELSKKTSVLVTHYLKCYIMNLPEDYCITTFEGEKISLQKAKSTEFYFKNLSYEDQCYILSYEACPVNLDFEKVYGQFFLLTKKRYLARKINEEGVITEEDNKGNCLVRRDGCKYLFDTYKELIDKIRENGSEYEVYNILYDRIHLLFTRQIPDTHLIIYMGIKSLIEYAKSETNEKGEKTPITEKGAPILDVMGPLDDRLVYSNIPQVLLALKITQRGEDIPPNTRLEFIYVHQDRKVEHQGEKAEDYTYYCENKKDENLKPDYLHYVEKKIAKPVTELLSIKFSKPRIPFISLEDRLFVFMKKFNELHRYNVANTNSYTKGRPKINKNKKIFIGWDALFQEDCYPTSQDNLANDCTFSSYSFKGNIAKITYIMEEIKFSAASDYNSIKKDSYPGLMDLCHVWKSNFILEKIYQKYGISKQFRKRSKDPSSTGPKIRVGTEVLLIKNIENNGKIILDGTLTKIVNREDIGTKKSPTFIYDLLIIETNEIITKVTRNFFTPFTVKDENFMKNILEYRTCYSMIIKELNEYFSPINIHKI
jgi:DNA polymerase elongation subunit (family B)